MMKLLKIFRKKSLDIEVKYWDFKRIPLYNWQMCQEGKYAYCRKGIDEDVESNITDLLQWQNMQDQYINEFQDHSVIEQNLKLRLKLANMKLKFIQNSKANRMLINTINEIEAQLRKKRDEDSHNGMTLDECMVLLSKHQGYHIQSNIAAYSFFTMLKTINKNG